jgi:lipopolysaccharide/colanic/teichoic acid biosynthesis glycosyltransferase
MAGPPIGFSVLVHPAHDTPEVSPHEALFAMTGDSSPHAFDVALDNLLGQAYSEQAFRCLLTIERKRSQRSGYPFALVLLHRDRALRVDAALACRLFSALWLSLRETDFVGWYREGHVAGAVLPQLNNAPRAQVSALIRQRIDKTLDSVLPADLARRFRVRVHYVTPTLKAVTPAIRPKQTAPRRGTLSARRQTRPPVMPEQLFRSVLVKHQKRGGRAGERVALLMIAADDRASLAEWAAVIEALAVATRETDILGWFEGRSQIGIILTEIRAFDDVNARELETRIASEIDRRLDADTVRRFSTRFHVEADDPVFTAAKNAGTWRISYAPIKRAMDVVGSLVLLVMLSPLFLLIATLVKAGSRGPVLFSQVRIGRGLKPFTMLKFRTMRADADPKPHREYVTWFITSSGDTGGPHTRVFKLTNDLRVTRLGRLLRKTSLDELPQLFNVVRGEMSLVGPRPPLPYELEQYKPWHYRRVVEAKPGITGLWQVSGRSRTTFDEMVRLDLRYARSCSLLTDARILMATPRAVLTGNGAC